MNEADPVPGLNQRSARDARPSPEGFPRPFGRYRLLKRLGEGGMGSVYLAEDTALVRRVALKIPLIGADDSPEARERFYREARAAATLDHPYLCPVYDVGEADGRLYLTMAYIEGKSLAESLRGEGLPARHVAALVGKLALALDAAHARGVIHRDLKPANVMIKANGPRREPVIVDFGLARREGADEVRVTKTGQVLGTLGYMAPEQVRGDAKEIGPACYIYALGVMLYELQTGRLPFNGSGLAVAGQILTQEPLPPSEHRPDLDPRLEAICLKAMAKKVGDRYPSMAALAASLTEYLRSAPSTSTSTSAATLPVHSPDEEAPRESGGHSLVGQLLGQLADTEAVTPPPLPPPLPKPEPEPTLARAGRPPRSRWPLVIAATLLGLIALGIFVAIMIKARRGPSSPIAEAPASGESFTNSIGMTLRLIPAGEFGMGTAPPQKDLMTRTMPTRPERFDVEMPLHPVWVTRPFYLGETEVTVGQFRRFVESEGFRTEVERNGQGGFAREPEAAAKKAVRRARYQWRDPGFAQDDDHPVVEVTWNDALAFCQWLSRIEGRRYRLPFEFEWEYACRAGTRTIFPGGDTLADLAAEANSADRSTREKYPKMIWSNPFRDGYPETAPVGKFRKNGFGLLDMLGNASEWCADGYVADSYERRHAIDPVVPPFQEPLRVTRGGAWDTSQAFCRPAARGSVDPSKATSSVGFRVACEWSPPKDSASPPSEASELAKLQGTWVLVAGEVSGEPIDLNVRGQTRTYEGNRVTSRPINAPGVPKAMQGKVTLRPERSPKEMDFLHLNGRSAGGTRRGIYEIHGDLLKICTSDPQTDDRPGRFRTIPDDGRTLHLWRRVKP